MLMSAGACRCRQLAAAHLTLPHTKGNWGAAFVTSSQNSRTTQKQRQLQSQPLACLVGSHQTPCVAKCRLRQQGILLRAIPLPTYYELEAPTCGTVGHNTFNLKFFLPLHQHWWGEVPWTLPMVGGQLGHVENGMKLAEPASQLQLISNFSNTRQNIKRTNKTLTKLRRTNQFEISRR